MTGRELLLRTLEFNNPERIPRQVWLLKWAEDHFPQETKELLQKYPDDIVYSPFFYKTQPRTKGDMFAVGTYIDEWGCEFINRQAGIIGEVKDPMVKSLDDLSVVRKPVECLSVDIDAVNAFCKEQDKFVMGGFNVRPFERLQFLRGTENVMMDLALHPEKIKKLIDIIHEQYLEEIKLWATTDVDGMFFMDDWGTQRSLLISPATWREMFKPLYKQYIDIAHENGKKMFVHSDGYIVDVFPDLIEMGLDAINSQIFCMGVEKLAPFAGKITFWGEIDRQYLLCEGTEEEIRAAVRSVYDALYKNGGVIGQVDFGVGAKPEKVAAAFQMWNEISQNELAKK